MSVSEAYNEAEEDGRGNAMTADASCVGVSDSIAVGPHARVVM